MRNAIASTTMNGSAMSGAPSIGAASVASGTSRAQNPAAMSQPTNAALPDDMPETWSVRTISQASCGDCPHRQTSEPRQDQCPSGGGVRCGRVTARGRGRWALAQACPTSAKGGFENELDGVRGERVGRLLEEPDLGHLVLVGRVVPPRQVRDP